MARTLVLIITQWTTHKNNCYGEETDYAINPGESEGWTGSYKIIYHGALLGEIFRGNSVMHWEAVTADDLQPGGFPVYEYDESSGHQDILLDEATVQEIGRQISR